MVIKSNYLEFVHFSVVTYQDVKIAQHMQSFVTDLSYLLRLQNYLSSPDR
jgi:hypothetical protein